MGTELDIEVEHAGVAAEVWAGQLHGRRVTVEEIPDEDDLPDPGNASK